MANCDTKVIIEKWYKRLGFDSKFDAEFYEALNTISISPDTEISTYPLSCEDGKKNLLAYLYMCEAVEKQYIEKGIPEKIMLDTLSDIVLNCEKFSELKGELYLGNVGWLSRHLKFYLFQLGRLQYCIQPTDIAFEKFGIKVGDMYVGIHIPATGPMRPEDCKESIDMARAFMEKYFPDVKYDYFSCSSWLLDETLKEYLPADSNILKFAAMFEIARASKSDDIIEFVFGLKANRENLPQQECKTSLARKVKTAILEGKDFYLARGFIKK